MLSAALTLSNEILTSAIVIVAFSMLLYNLWRNSRDRVTRTSGVVLMCVTIAYAVDAYISLNPSLQSYETGLRLQWIGLAVLPAALFHLSDALLATTGLPSRGRRRLGIRILYIVGAVFLAMAAFSDLLIEIVPLPQFNDTVASMRAGPLFPVYVAYYLSATGLALNNVNRARKRCITRSTRRRMAYLQFALVTPAVGIFPYSVLLGTGGEFTLPALILVNIANAVIILMLVFLSYPLSFFGSRVPDRVVKSELLSMFLRGPSTGLLVLATIVLLSQTSRFFGMASDRFVPFAVVAVVLMWQWAVAIAKPSLESVLIYGDEDSDQLNKLRDLSDRLMSRSDLVQLMNGTLRALCDYLQVSTAFVASLDQTKVDVVEAIGPSIPSSTMIAEKRDDIVDMLTYITIIDTVPVREWHGYWIAPLFSRRLTRDDGQPTLIGILGIQARAQAVNLTDDEQKRLTTFVRRIEQTLDDLSLQGEIYAALEGLLPQVAMTRARAAEMDYLPGRSVNGLSQPPTLPDHDQLVEQVKAALRHYWGGPGLSRSRLLELQVVRDCMAQNDNPAQALRSVLQEAIDSQRPDGERKSTDPEWTLYNILELRFVKGQKVTDVANRLAIAEATLYRRQRDAIEAVANAIERMERDRFEQTG